MRVAGSVAVITGSASGFGRALANRLAAGGGRVVLGDIEVEGGQQAADEINARYSINGARVAIFQQCDVRKVEDLEALVKLAYDTFGDHHIMVNNAGVINDGGYLKSEPERNRDAVKRMCEVNLLAVVEGTGVAMRNWIHSSKSSVRTDRCVVNTASLAGLVPYSPVSIYAATKSAVIHHTACLAPYAERNGIRVNCVAPYGAKTKMLLESFQFEPMFKEAMDLMGMVEVERVVDAMMMCIEDEGLVGEAITIAPDPDTGGIIEVLCERPTAML